MHSRHELAAALSKPGRYITEYRPSDDERVVSTTTPLRMLGIVIHRRLFISQNTSNKMCLECPILDHVGDAHSMFQNFLFTSECISAYLTRSKSNVVVCDLHHSCNNEGYESVGFPLSQTQPSVQYLSQSAQMGYGVAPTSHFEQMGYGVQPTNQFE